MDCYFDDEKVGLSWERYDEADHSKSEWYAELNKQLNNWRSENIKQYITYSIPVGDQMMAFLDINSGLYFCFENRDLVGVVFMTEPFNDEFDASMIEYIVVNPDAQGRGVGTRMIKSIKDNPMFFTSGKHRGKIQASVKPSNIASQKAFLKNGFRVVKPAKKIPTTLYYRFEYRDNDHSLSN